MPNLDLHAQKQEPQSEVTLEQLLKLKRYEKPDSGFWERFDRDLQQRTLQTLVKRPSVWSRIPERLTHPRLAVLSATTCVLFGFLVFLEFYRPVAPRPEMVSSPLPAPVSEETAHAAPQEVPHSPSVSFGDGVTYASTGQARFVVDSLSHEQESGQYRKVMAIEGLPFAVEGVRYVADPLPGGAARVFASTPSLQHF